MRFSRTEVSSLLGRLGLDVVQGMLELPFGLPVLALLGVAPVTRRELAVLGDVGGHPVPANATSDAGPDAGPFKAVG
eukprot:5237647-Lingulodinium_polyedra.AAC.1